MEKNSAVSLFCPLDFKNDGQWFCTRSVHADSGSVSGGCGGDSGGPMMVNQPTNRGPFILVGVTSSISGADQIQCTTDTTRFVNIAHYKGWINENIAKLEMENTCD